MNKSASNFNLKMAWVPNDSFLFSGRTHTGYLVVTNIGAGVAAGLSYKLTCDDETLTSIDYDPMGALGSIYAGNTKRIPVSLTFDSFESTFGRKALRLDVSVTDA